MTLLPIVVRELRVAARRKSTYRARFGTAFAAVAAVAVLLIVLNLNRIPLIPDTGVAVFMGLAWIGFLYCITLAANTADCISEEKREGTLGLLFLTDLSGWDVALGKLCANSLKSFYAVLGAFPVVAVVMLLGGVSIGQYCKVALALLNLFFFVHATGLLASTLSRVLSRAQAATAALLIGFLAGPPLLALALAFHDAPLPPMTISPLILFVAAVSPGYAFAQALMSIVSVVGRGPGGWGLSYWVSLLLVHLLSWVLLALAAWRLPHCWQEKAGPARLRWRDRLRQWAYGPPAFREGLRRKLVGVNPFLWLVSRNRLAPLVIPISLCVTDGLCIWGWCEFDWQDRFVWLVVTVVANHLLLLLGVASEASGHLQAERRNGALDFVLCSTPLQVGDILGAHWELLRRRFFWPLIAVLVTDVVALLLSQSSFVRADSEDRTYFAWFLAGAMVMLVADAVAAGWVGMWRAMVQRLSRKTAGAGSATIETVGLLVFVPTMGLWMIALILLLFRREDFLDRYFNSFGPVYGVWFLFSFSAAVGLSKLARKKLLTRFREMARVESGETIGILGQLGRWLGKMMR
jgi:ABC-type transport system involved in multi-copper enzyme maturation permease subunit